MLSFMDPQKLWLLIVPLAIFVLYVGLSLRHSTGGRGRTRLDLVLPKNSAFKRHISVLAAILALVSLIVAAAKPAGEREVPRERATVVVTIDVSLSMEANDVEPNRMIAAKQGAKDFVDSLPSTFNVALVSFAGTATMVSPPTTDRNAIKRAIDSLQMIPATAIGEGIYTSLDALKYAPPDPKHPDEPAPGAIVLLSDGATKVGRASDQAARDAREQGVPIYTIAYGTPWGTVTGSDGIPQNVPVNHRELYTIADISGGKKYAAESLASLADVYQTIARDIGYEKVPAEVTERFALYAMICSIIASLGVVSLAARWP